MIDTVKKRSISGANLLLIVLTTGHLVNDFYGHVLPFLLPSLIATFSLSYFEAGLLALATTVLSGVLQPVLGYLADKHAIRKKFIIVGFLAFCIGFVLIGSSISYTMVLIACFVIGLGEATFHPQSTNFLTGAFPNSKGRVMGIHGLGGSIGNFLAPLVVAFLIAAVGWRAGTYLLAIPGLAVVVLLSFVLNGTEPATRGKVSDGLTWQLFVLALNFALILMLYKGFLTFLPTFLVESGASIKQAGLISALMLFVGLLAQPLGGLYYDKLGGRVVFFGCAVGAGIALWLFTLSNGFWLIFYTILIGVFTSALFPLSLAMASALSKGNRVGLSVGLVFGVSGTLSALTPVITGYAADLFGLRPAFQLLVILAGLAAILSLSLPGKNK